MHRLNWKRDSGRVCIKKVVTIFLKIKIYYSIGTTKEGLEVCSIEVGLKWIFEISSDFHLYFRLKVLIQGFRIYEERIWWNMVVVMFLSCEAEGGGDFWVIFNFLKRIYLYVHGQILQDFHKFLTCIWATSLKNYPKNFHPLHVRVYSVGGLVPSNPARLFKKLMSYNKD